MNMMINYSSKWWYKLITIILVFALILYFSIGFAPKAHAVVVSTVIVGSVLAAMAAAGIGLTVSGMTAQQLTQWVSDKLNDWTADIGGSVQDHINGNLITVTANGILSIGTAAAQGISDFLSWLQNEDNITDNNVENILTEYSTFNGYNVAVLPTGYLRFNMPSGAVWNINYYTEAGTCYYYFDQNWNMQVISTYNRVEYYMQEGGYGTNWGLDGPINGYYYGSGLNLNTADRSQFQDLQNSISARNMIQTDNVINQGAVIDYDTGVITIPTIEDGEKWYIDVGADAGEDIDTVTDGVITDTLTNTLDVSDEIVESNAQEVVIVNEDAIAVNVDHHMIGFTNLPDFAHLNLNSIWHYVSDAVDYASSWLAWFVSFLTAMPLLAIPLYMSFTLLVVLSFLRRFI